LFIVVFLSVGLSGKTRKNVMLMSLASCISAAVLFYVMQMITMLLAKFGAISPFMGAWFPVFMFVVIATVVLRYART
jgi:lipopolysaccharide export system permease protein